MIYKGYNETTTTKGTIMSKKQKVTNVKNRIVELFNEKPLEMIAVTATLLTGVAKVTKVVIESQNAVSWRREVNRRNRNSEN